MNDYNFNIEYNKKNICKDPYKLIDSILLSIDSYNLIFTNTLEFNNNINEAYYLVNFNFNFNYQNLVKLIKLVLDDNIECNSNVICDNYYIIYIKQNNELVLIIHLYNMPIFDYCLTFTEPFFDCNLIYRNYTGYNIIYNYHTASNLSYDDIIRRNYNKKFSYISNNFKNIEDYILEPNNNLATIKNTQIINKLVYAIKLIKNNWIMDEYILNENSWTINYWKNYKNLINIIKFNNSNNDLEKKCKICSSEFIEENIVFNKSNLYVHYNCLFDILNT